MNPRRSLSLFVVVIAFFEASTLGAAETITMTQRDCAALVRHFPGPDVAYRPGADVRGRPVVPADLAHSRPIEVPATIVVPISIDLRDRLAVAAGARLHDPRADIGTVVYRDGRAWFNGHPLPDDGAAALAAACRRGSGRRD